MSDRTGLIFVDLDGTLIRSDIFIEGMLHLVRRNPARLFQILFWLLRGIHHAKTRVATALADRPVRLPYETELLDWLTAQKAAGRSLVLATAAHRIQAEKVAAECGLFDAVLATETSNLKARRKLEAIRHFAAGRPFSYAGDSAADRCIWEAAAGAILVNAPAREIRNAVATGKAEKIISSQPPRLKALKRQMRPHQYAKNILIFVPLIAAHGYFDPSALVASVLAFLCFCACASGIYCFNDLIDLDHDRAHPSKSRRPLASGDLSLHHGVAGAILLLLFAFLLAAFTLPAAFLAALLGYAALSIAYSLYLKRVSTADVMTLSVLYTLRVLAGGAAAGIALSSWLFAFSMFVFVSLGYLKRYIEIARPSGTGVVPGRNYTAADAAAMFSLGTANMTASVIILALYINTSEVARHYGTPDLLWLLCLLILYWGNRIWVGAQRNRIDDDPVAFAVRDRVSQLVVLGFVIVTAAARYLTLGDWFAPNVR